MFESSAFEADDEGRRPPRGVSLPLDCVGSIPFTVVVVVVEQLISCKKKKIMKDREWLQKENTVRRTVMEQLYIGTDGENDRFFQKEYVSGG